MEQVIRWCLENRILVLVLAVALAGWGVYALQHSRLDAIPDLSDVQVIVHTSFPGQAPQVVEDQVTYPVSSAMLSVPGARGVRGVSMFGDSYVHVLFDDDTDLYWARSRVLEYLSQVAAALPANAEPVLGPDATGVGWVYQYALVDRSGTHDLAQLRGLQDWFLRFELQALADVAEVATLGGMERQYQVVLDPDRLRAYGLTLPQVRQAVQRANRDAGGALIEMAEAEYMVRSLGYLRGLDDLAGTSVGITGPDGTAVRLGDVAEIRVGPRIRRGIATLDGEGEVVGGIIVMRHGANALEVIDRVKARIDELRSGLPEGVEIVETYDRSELIHGTVRTLTDTLLLEFLVVALVCLIFLLHLRSALVAIIALPMGILAAFIAMQQQGLTVNVMSLGGIAVALGAMVDASIVMIENAHRRLQQTGPSADRLQVVREAGVQTARPLFFALLVIAISFLPLFALEGQEGRLFHPLAFTGAYAMAAAAGLAVTLVPVLIYYLARGRLRTEGHNPLSRLLAAIYLPLLRGVLRFPKSVLIAVIIIALSVAWPLPRLGAEFMPDIDEGDLMYMPTLDPGISIDKVREFTLQADRLIRSVPEVRQVFGKAGRAGTATDPAPLGMLETMIRFHPRSEWRPGKTREDLVRELDARLQFPGVGNVWVMPIKTRIDMLATGIRSPVGVKIAGPDLEVIERLGREVEGILREVPGTVSAFADRPASGRYVEIGIDRGAAARHGLNVEDLQEVVELAIGGADVTETVEGRERYTVNLRYPQDRRDSPERLRALPIVTPSGSHVAFGDVARIEIRDGPPMIRSENARPNGWVVADIRGRDLGSYVVEARRQVADQLALPPGYSLAWSGQFEYYERARERLLYIVPATLALIVALLYLAFRSLPPVVMILCALPFSLVGGVWLLYLLGFHLSVAVAVGFILLMGLSTTFGVVMLAYIDEAVRRRRPGSPDALREAIIEGAVLRVRPVTMTVATTLGALLVIMLTTGPGSEAMHRIAAPMLGGMVSAPLVSLFLLPLLYRLWYGRRLS